MSPPPDTPRSRIGPWVATALSLAGVVLMGVADYVTGEELSFSAFYLIPIAFSSWVGGRWSGLLTACAACLIWLGADLSTVERYRHPVIPYWNAGVRLVIFVATAFMLSELRDRLRFEERLSRTDALTGALNGRAFRERLEHELGLCRRYGRPFTLAYIDLDHFKRLNDERGHQAGDQALAEVASAIREGMRDTDALARLGGDEFAVLLTETDFEDARRICARLLGRARDRMAESGWPVGLSAGAVTFRTPPASVAEAIHRADELMYTAKRRHKGTTEHRIHPAETAEPPPTSAA